MTVRHHRRTTVLERFDDSPSPSADNPVNAPRREFTLSAFRVSSLSRMRFDRSAGPYGALDFERHKVRRQPWGLLPHPRIRVRNSRTLDLQSKVVKSLRVEV